MTAAMSSSPTTMLTIRTHHGRPVDACLRTSVPRACYLHASLTLLRPRQRKKHSVFI